MKEFNDAIMIQKGSNGNKVDKILSESIIKLKKSGKLQVLFSKIHKPYDNWQPSEMGW